MKKALFLAAMLVSGAALAGTDHYVLRDGNHVQHMKISTVGKDTTVSVDVDFEPNSSEPGKNACSNDIAGHAKFVNDNELTVKKQIDGEARYCTLKIQLSANGAKIEQSEDCSYFAAGICHFATDGKELVKIK